MTIHHLPDAYRRELIQRESDIDFATEKFRAALEVGFIYAQALAGVENMTDCARSIYNDQCDIISDHIKPQGWGEVDLAGLAEDVWAEGMAKRAEAKPPATIFELACAIAAPNGEWMR